MPPQLNLLQINSQFNPGEGPVLFTVSIPWGTLAAAGYNPANVYPINAQQQAQSGRFSRCQAVFINNTASPYGITIFCVETQQEVSIPPFTQGVYPLYCAANPSFVVTQNQSFSSYQGQPVIPTTSFIAFLNIPVLPWQQNQQPLQQASFGSFGILIFNSGAWNVPQPMLSVPNPNQNITLYSINIDFIIATSPAFSSYTTFYLSEGSGGKGIGGCSINYSPAGLGYVRSFSFTWGDPGYVFNSSGVPLYGAFTSNVIGGVVALTTTLSYSLVTLQ